MIWTTNLLPLPGIGKHAAYSQVTTPTKLSWSISCEDKLCLPGVVMYHLNKIKAWEHYSISVFCCTTEGRYITLKNITTQSSDNRKTNIHTKMENESMLLLSSLINMGNRLWNEESGVRIPTETRDFSLL